MAKVDLTVLAIPAFIGSMGAEYWWYRRHPVDPDTWRPGDYSLADTLASVTMGLGSLFAPYVAKRVLDPVTPGRGRYAKVLVGAGLAAAGLTAVGDVLRVKRRAGGSLPTAGTLPAAFVGEEPTPMDRITGASAVAAVAAIAVTASTTWAARTSGARLFERNRLDLGGGVLGTLVAVFGWDLIYYWNHRFSHESRWLWAVHVAHHSSEHYNLSTALRQPVADGITLSVPYGLLALLGVRPDSIERARQLNLIYQFWIHTEVVRSIGWLERVLNTPSHHRVHHGSNRQYLDRNHGSILIVWDRLFGTFEPEVAAPIYGLTKNIDTFNPARIATHELVDIGRDIAGSRTWRDRFGFLLRGPGWAALQRERLALR